jgi:hypothetical protein
MISPQPVTLNARRYNAFAQVFTALDAKGYAVPLFGCAARLQARTAAGAADPPLLDLSTDGVTENGSGLSIDDNGNIALLVAAADLAAAVTGSPASAPATLAWDMLVSTPDQDTPLSSHYGTWIVNPSVTTAPAAIVPRAPGALDLSNPYGGVENALVLGVL